MMLESRDVGVEVGDGRHADVLQQGRGCLN